MTRSLGDASMKEFVVGSPYTTETVLDDEDEFLIVACDGVSNSVCRWQLVSLLHLVHRRPTGFALADNSSGTCARTRTLSTWCAASRTHKRRPRSCSSTRWATTRPTT